MSDEELKELIHELTNEEREVSYRRRVLHGRIDILRAELVNRLKVKREAGDATITGADVQQLTEILLGKVPASPEENGSPPRDGGRLVALHCPECGFVNAEGANYCQKCGAFLGRPEGEDGAEHDDLQGRRDRRVHAGRHRRGGRQERRRARDPLRRRAGGGELPGRPGADEHRAHARRGGLPRRRHRLAQPRAARPSPGRSTTSTTSARSTAPTSTGAGSSRTCWTTATRSRSASTSSATWSETRIGDGGCDRQSADRTPSGSPSRAASRLRRLAPAQGADDRRRGEDPRPGVRRHLDLEDPLPRGPEAARPAPHRRAATASTARPTSSACGRSCACSATSSCRCG